MRFFKIMALCAVVVGTLAGCASNEPQSAVQGGQRVGVISAIGDSLQYRQMGSVAINNETIAASITDWGFDPYVEGVIAQTLGPRYTIEGVQVDRTQPTLAAMALAAGSSRIGNPLDFYVIVVPVERRHYLAEKTNTAVGNAGMMYGAIGMMMASAIAGDEGQYKGLGIYRAPGRSEQYVYAIADVVMIDGRTYQELRRTPLYAMASQAQATQVNGAASYRDMRLVGQSTAWPDDFSQFAPSQLQDISDEMALLLQSQVSYSLRQIGLVY